MAIGLDEITNKWLITNCKFNVKTVVDLNLEVSL